MWLSPWSLWCFWSKGLLYRKLTGGAILGLADFPVGLLISFVQAFGVCGLPFTLSFHMWSRWHGDLLLGFLPFSCVVFCSYVAFSWGRRYHNHLTRSVIWVCEHQTIGLGLTTLISNWLPSSFLCLSYPSILPGLILFEDWIWFWLCPSGCSSTYS